jgi:hypothetical protein
MRNWVLDRFAGTVLSNDCGQPGPKRVEGHAHFLRKGLADAAQTKVMDFHVSSLMEILAMRSEAMESSGETRIVIPS